MEIIELSPRHTVFKAVLEGWDLHLHLIKAENHNYLIDTGIGKESMDEVLAYLNHDSKPLRVINSHYHWDHIMGNEFFTENMIISHALCPELIETNWDKSMDAAKAYSKFPATKVLPNTVFDQELYFSNDGIRLFHTPGHSPDGISVFDEVEGVLNMGDNLGDSIEAIMPSLDTSKAVYAKTLESCQSMKPKCLISGHCGIQPPEIINTVLELLK